MLARQEVGGLVKKGREKIGPRPWIRLRRIRRGGRLERPAMCHVSATPGEGRSSIAGKAAAENSLLQEEVKPPDRWKI